MKNKSQIQKLKNYFKKNNDVLMAFLFGSQAKQLGSSRSDWDIGIYFKPLSNTAEWENGRDYPEENKIWGDLVDILNTDNVDLIVLNRAPANIAAAVIQGSPLVVKDRRLYLEFMLIVTREAEDFRQTAREYAKIYWRSLSLGEADKDILNRRLVFLDSELRDADKFYQLTQSEYEKDRMQRRQVERWIENLMNAAIDISKTILASRKRPVPSNYKEILRGIGSVPSFSEELGNQLAEWTELRNILAHEYLDIRWKRIKNFIAKSDSCFQKFIKAVKKFIKD